MAVWGSVRHHLAESPDGRAVRHLEDALTRLLQVPQTVRAAVKLQALANMADLSAARATPGDRVTVVEE
jgi:hypothetical protein